MNDSLTILYIEDNADDAYIFQEFVRHIPKQIHIDIKPTLKEGLSAIESNSGYDLILVDLSLPDSRGLRSIEKIVELNSLLDYDIYVPNVSDKIDVAVGEAINNFPQR